MDKKSVRITFNFDFNKIKNNRNKSHFYCRKYKSGDVNVIDGEIWKYIKDFGNIYSVSNEGRIKNNITNKLMTLFIVGDYYKVSLKAKPYFVHKLVAKAFIDNPDNKPCVDHIDTNPLNNNVENLRWATIKENNNNPLTVKKQIDRLRKYNIPRKLQVIKFKYKDYDNYEIFESVLDAAKNINGETTNISKTCKANAKLITPRHLCKGYCFMYKTDFLILHYKLFKKTIVI